MIVVIIAGGSGTRLWPLSTVNYPKHLLSLTNERSLLQNTFDRVKDLANDVFIIPEASHATHVYEQLPEVPKKNVLVEPARRGTASCVIWALSEIRRRKLADQPIFFLWADHLIRDTKGFSGTVKLADELADKLDKLVFMGIEPSYPSTGLGYMKKGERLANGFKNVYELEKFVEKPDLDTAEEYLESGEYLWNTGYIVGKRSTFERDIEMFSPRLWADYQQLLESENTVDTYMGFTSEAIDTALNEHVTDGLVVPGNFDWLDVGSFHDLHGASRQDLSGNYVKGDNVELENVSNSLIRNEQNIPVVVIGLDNVAVVSTKNGILVTNKNYAQKVGDIAKKIQAKETGK